MRKRTPFILIFTLLAALSAAAEIPSDIVWTTNNDDPLIGSPKALKGGTYNTYMNDYPLTFRLMGPNSNDAFAGWNRANTMNFTLVQLHPVTDRPIPWMATHWSIQKDNKTVYYKIDPTARWSDGKPITADDFVFTFEMMQSEHIVDPFYNEYADNYYESVEAVDTHTLKIVGKKETWRPLFDYDIFPTPRHATKLDPDWVKRETNTFQVAPGPYVVTEADTGKKVVLEKVKNWWGEDKRYFKGLYNVDKIVIHVFPTDRGLDYFKKEEIDILDLRTSKVWVEETDFPALKKGWAHKKRIFVDNPQGINGLQMNLQFPLFQNKDFRKAMQYLFPFDLVNKNIMYDAYYREVSAFHGTPYANPDLKPYGFDPSKAREHLIKAGFTKRGPDGILMDAKGNRASFTLSHGEKGMEPHLTVIQNIYKKAGVEMQLQLLDRGTAFRNGLERKFEMTLTGRLADFYPDPRQYFHSDFIPEKNNNNIWGFGSPETDKLIETYEFDMDEQKRLKAMHDLDAIVQDEAFYIPFWNAPYLRLLYWDHICWPDFFLPMRTEIIPDWKSQVFWIDPAKKKRLEKAKAEDINLGEDKIINVDPWGVKARMQDSITSETHSENGDEPLLPKPKETDGGNDNGFPRFALYGIVATLILLGLFLALRGKRKMGTG